MQRALIAAVALLAAPALSAAPLSLLDDRFSVEAEWRTADGQTGIGTPVALTRETGYFWFFSPTNTEVVVKVLDGCAVTDRFWVFAGGLTDIDVTLTVTDETNGAKKVYRNAQGTPFAPIQDTGAFATCALERCGQGRFADLAASPRLRPDLEVLAAILAGSVVAPQATYDRVVTDVAAIAADNPLLAGIGFESSFDPEVLYLDVGLATQAAIDGGTYTAWSCLNRRYGFQQAGLPSPDPNRLSVKLQTTKTLDIRRLLAKYLALPGVSFAYQDDRGGGFSVPGGPQAFVPSYCGRIVGSRHEYFVRLASGPIYRYLSSPGGAPVAAGSSEEGLSGSWLGDATACFASYVDPH